MAGTKSNTVGFSGPLFITGMWRSGSSLLHALLNKHSRIGLMYEADLCLMRQAFWIPGESHWAERWDAWNRAVSRHGFQPEQLQQEAQGFVDAFETVHREYADRKGADIWGDKSPEIYDRMVPLARDFPSARFIVVWRHPGSTIASMQQAAGKGARFFQKRGMSLRGLIGNRKLANQCRRLRKMGVPVCEVDYEELVGNTDKVMWELCEFLEIPFEPGLTSLEGANRESAHSGGHHSLLRGDKIISKPRAQILPAKTERKIRRYIGILDEEDRRKWQGDNQEPQTGNAGWPERLFDYGLYYGFRCLDEFKRLGFCFAPIKLIQQYRKRRGHG